MNLKRLNYLLFTVIMVCFTITSCSSDDESINYELFDANEVAGPMELSRSVYIDDLLANSVTVEWEKPEGVSDETLKYAMYLDDVFVEEIEIDYTSFSSNFHSYKFQNLTQGESYNVKIVCLNTTNVVLVTQYIVIHCNLEGATEFPPVPTNIISIFANFTSDLFVYNSVTNSFALQLQIPQLEFPGATITIIDDGLRVLSNIAADGVDGITQELEGLENGRIYQCSLIIKLDSGFCLALPFIIPVPPCPVC